MARTAACSRTSRREVRGAADQEKRFAQTACAASTSLEIGSSDEADGKSASAASGAVDDDGGRRAGVLKESGRGRDLV